MSISGATVLMLVFFLVGYRGGRLAERRRQSTEQYPETNHSSMPDMDLVYKAVCGRCQWSERYETMAECEKAAHEHRCMLVEHDRIGD